ncbi:RibD family protein [Desulforamulus hydrothermalis]|uniref:Pyrimidine reductase, riboflavin biosynthesis n=1 Tax=Desulforamulus hydrothermalis Lam5 = DSM 18033 TaxID=1121428 RepID=K8DWS6_9FIRM|nr:RibD family protein [Desulforamulus hydrothermalis]CCO06869.1 Pyrimidine reductase, riboflavin biosynthesis [Desulforamulus hydrothermalis Lam5 = DSM 18033]SHH46234.1 Pyrimidine reductase, riboflavin biosynthesis [Desulforamulus hydrothermalis Lam5 = DSM 18033]
MDRPYIICHMVMSLDGKVTGDFLGKSEYGKFIEDYYRIHREYGADGFLCGRVTMEGSFPQPPVSPHKYDGPPIAREDYIAHKAAFYAVAVDPKGKLWWNGRAISDPDEGYDGAHIIEVLTESVPDAFLAHLRDKGVSYIFGGKTELELALVLKKLKNLFSIEKLLLEGGGNVNGSFLQEELIDEISLVVIPAAECSENAIPLFKTGKYGAKTASAKSFHLKEAKRLNDDGLWLIYSKN